MTAPTARKWLGRDVADGAAGMADASSRPKNSPKPIFPGTALRVVELCRKGLLQAQIAQHLGVSAATVSLGLAFAGLSKLPDLQPRQPAQLYEHGAPGDLLQNGIKKLGASRGPAIGGWQPARLGRWRGCEFRLLVVEDHARIAYTGMHPNERKESACSSSAVIQAYRPQTTARRAVHPVGTARMDLGLDLPGRPAQPSPWPAGNATTTGATFP